MSKEKLSHLERMIAIAAGQGVALGDATDHAAADYPQLWEWLARTQVGDRVKAPARLTFQLTPGGVAVALMDPGLCVSMDAACTFLADGFEALEKLLNEPNPPLRVWDGREPRLRKKREAT